MLRPINRVLVVDDDPVSLRFLEIALTRAGYSVVTAEDAAAAEEQLMSASIGAFACVVTDYRMPDRTGLELLAWIKERDRSLTTILVTAEGDRRLIAESLRAGAIDFLEKPVDLRVLEAAVARAVEQTSRHRHMADSESAVKELGRAQQRMLGVDALESAGRVDLCFYPKRDAGGDFFSRFRLAPNRLFCLLTDVSGHDLHAAYISAYFQGMVRGLLSRDTPVEEIFPDFNRFLLDEWNQPESAIRNEPGVSTSVAACAVLIDFCAQTATVFTQGTPAPVYFLPDGELQAVGERGGHPLGWFSNLSCHGVKCSIAEGGTFCMWTDGLEELAEKLGVSALSLAHVLQATADQKQKPPWIDAATDDMLLASIHLSAPDVAADRFQPLILERYHGGQSGEIDESQAFWQRSLALAVPNLPEPQMYDILLATREALLNALTHGCGGSPDLRAELQVAYSPRRKTIRIRVTDPGPGHHFDLVQHERGELFEDHRGLILIEHLAKCVDFDRNGASVFMHFSWA